MKTLLLSVFLISASFIVSGQNHSEKKSTKAMSKDSTLTVEASCGQCNFKLPGKGCNLAVKIGDSAYFVDGAKIDDHGDAHAEDGFCNTIRHAKVKGKVVDNRFKATYFKLLPQEEKDK